MELKKLSASLVTRIIILGNVLLFNLPTSSIEAQVCGTTLEKATEIDQVAWQAFRNRWATQRNLQKVSIGITIHIVQEVAGASNIDVNQLYNELDAVNSFFTSSGLEFFFCGSPRTIHGAKSIYTYDEAADLLNGIYHVPNTINIFYLDEIGNHELNNFACGISTFPFNSTPESRFIIMQKGCSTNGATLAHEIGHFFGLLHTHETAVGRELVNGSNCESAGDRICDTPADPNLSLTGLNGCTYQALFTDPAGDVYRPDPSNIMSYAPAACQRRFTKEQSMSMNFWYESELSYLLTSCDHYPDYAIYSDQQNLTIGSGQTLDLEAIFEKNGNAPDQKVVVVFILDSPANPIPFTIYRDTVVFDGEIGQFIQHFEIPIPLAISTGQYMLTILLDPDGTILERDKRNNIYVLNLTIDNSGYADITIFPNPASEYLRVFLRDKQLSGQVYFDISDLLGRQYTSTKNFKSREEIFVELDLHALRYGPYILTITFEKINKTESFLFIKE